MTTLNLQQVADELKTMCARLREDPDDIFALGTIEECARALERFVKERIASKKAK